jgi:hypothetical protein
MISRETKDDCTYIYMNGQLLVKIWDKLHNNLVMLNNKKCSKVKQTTPVQIVT